MKRFAVLAVLLACHKPGPAQEDAGASAAPRASVEPARPGMAFVPAGTLLAGTPADRTPRVAEEEAPGTPVDLGAFYIDLYPYPNEAGAIPTSNVTRDEGEQLCAAKGKRLCSELEWERACKGPDNLPYEYGEAYKAPSCGTGVVLVQAARRPTGEHPLCKSGFGVIDLHGGALEWTASTWRRGSTSASLGTLRGGNAAAGDLAGRCANAVGRPVTKKDPTFGFRCCTGPKNPNEVEIEPKGTPGLASTKVVNPVDGAIERAWRWLPAPNDELSVLARCRPGSACTLLFSRSGVKVIELEVGPSLPELVRNGDARNLRFRTIDGRGTYHRDVVYTYGRIDPSPILRP